MKSLAHCLTLLSTIAISIAANLPAQAQRARVFVSVNGDDANPCTGGSPCKTFQHAHDVVLAGGEISVLNTGGYGTLTITKAISIVVPAGIEAAIATPAAGTAITIQAQPSDVVSLRGLMLDGNGLASFGISFQSGGSLEIVDCNVRSFQSTGISVQSATPTSVMISNTNITNNRSISPVYGMYLDAFNAGGTIMATLDNVTFNNNGRALQINAVSAPVEVQISNSHIDSSADYGLGVGSGFATAASSAVLRYVTFNQTPTAIGVFGNGTVWLSQITQTAAPSFPSSAGIIFSNSNNAAYSDGTNRLMGAITGGTLQLWTQQ
jgi:hypothetical protein